MTKMKQNIKLDDIPKRSIYQVPEGYFDRLPMCVMERVSGPERVTAPWYASLWSPLRLALAPLALLLVLSLVYVLNMKDESENHTASLATVADTEIVDYLSTYAVLESTDLAEINSLSGKELPADFLNVSANTAEEELEYAQLNNIEL